MAEWVGATVSARAICGLVVLSLHVLLAGAARLGDRLFQGHPLAQLFSVMILCPLLMNMLQARPDQEYIMIWLLYNLVEASFHLFRYLLLGDQLSSWELHPLVSYTSCMILNLL